jgi:XrtN system VIT domain protein
LVFPDKGLSDCSFSFDGNTYSLASYHKRLNPVNIRDLYLDINRSWSRTEFNKIIDAAGKYNVYVSAKELVRVTPENKAEVFSELTKDEFSLFPLYKIKDPANSILVTKGSTNSCNVDDLEQTPFIEQTKKFLAADPKIRLFNIGGDLAPYLKSLKEYRVFQYDYGDLDILSHILTDNLFVNDTEDDDRVIIHKTDMVIQRSNGNTASSGPDHVMRLFVYNHIMQKLGAGLMLNRPIEDKLVEEARKAYVVTPLSSLVVLETEKDYERFNINDSANSLKNASLGSKGAAPEPHEWLLIITGVLLITYMKFRKRIKWAKA